MSDTRFYEAATVTLKRFKGKDAIKSGDLKIANRRCHARDGGRSGTQDRAVHAPSPPACCLDQMSAGPARVTHAGGASWGAHSLLM